MTNTLQDRRAFFDSLVPKRIRDAARHGEFYRDRVRWLSRIVPHDASVIDIGCGIGTVLSALPNTEKTGIDFSERMIEQARKNDTTSEYVVDDAEELRYAKTHEYVLLLDTINYLKDVQKAFENIRSNLCTDDTRVVITAFNFLWSPVFRIGEIFGYKTKFPAQNWLDLSDIRNLLEMSGFEVIETGGRMLCPVWIPLLSALCNRILASLPLLRRLCLVQTIIARPIAEPQKNFSVTVLSAMRNEKGNVASIVNAMPLMGISTEVLFIEGHSTDGTWEEIERVRDAKRRTVTVRGLKQPGKGKADALHHGIRESTGDILIVYDGDFTVHPSELPKLYDALASGRAEFVNGSRLVYPMHGKAMPILNLLGNKTFSALFSWLFSQPIVDVLSPVKAFYRRDYARMTTRMDPFGDFDLFFGAAKQHRRIRETPVHYLERTYGHTKMRPFRHAALLLRMWCTGAKDLKWM